MHPDIIFESKRVKVKNRLVEKDRVMKRTFSELEMKRFPMKSQVTEPSENLADYLAKILLEEKTILPALAKESRNEPTLYD